jgi:transposase
MANRRFEMFEVRQIVVRMRLGETDRQIAKSGLCGRRKAAWLRATAAERGWLDPKAALPEDAVLAGALSPAPQRASSESSLSAYAEDVKRWQAEGLTGVVIHQALVRKHGYRGHYSAVRRFLQKLDRGAPPERTTWLEFAPAEAAQVDFGKGPRIADALTGEVVDAWFFVMTLAWSRHQYVELVRDQTTATWLACHRNAFEFFGGVPERVIIDNAKCAITRACFHDPEVGRSYAEFAEGYGFKITACPPRDPKKKGRVEAGVKYVKRNFLPLRAFRSLPEANEQVITWVLETAGLRDHGTTKEKPYESLLKTERHLLAKLPERRPEIAAWARVKLHGNCHVQFERCYYSAPYRFVSESLWLRAGSTTVQLYREHELVAVHPRKSRPGDRSTVRDHLPPEAVAYLMRDPTWCRAQADAIGPACLALVERLFSHRVLDNLKAAQGVIRLAKTYGTERLERACVRALDFNDPRYRTVKLILERELEAADWPESGEEKQRAKLELLSPVYTGQGRFCRDSRTILVESAVPLTTDEPERKRPYESHA